MGSSTIILWFGKGNGYAVRNSDTLSGVSSWWAHATLLARSLPWPSLPLYSPPGSRRRSCSPSQHSTGETSTTQPRPTLQSVCELAGCGRPTSGGQYRDHVLFGNDNFFFTFVAPMTSSFDKFGRRSLLEIMQFPKCRPQQRGERE